MTYQSVNPYNDMLQVPPGPSAWNPDLPQGLAALDHLDRGAEIAAWEETGAAIRVEAQSGALPATFDPRAIRGALAVPTVFEASVPVNRIGVQVLVSLPDADDLATVLAVKLEDRGGPLTITWHSSCHALREMDVIRYSKALIQQLKNVTLVQLERETGCCGFGGTFAVKQPAISAAMVKDKVDDAKDKVDDVMDSVTDKLS